MDNDYLGALDPKDKAWLRTFLAAEYGGDRRAQRRLRYTAQQRRAANHSRYANRYDVFTQAAQHGALDYE